MPLRDGSLPGRTADVAADRPRARLGLPSERRLIPSALPLRPVARACTPDFRCAHRFPNRLRDVRANRACRLRMSDHRLRDIARLHIASGTVYRGPPPIIGVGMNAFDPDLIPLALTFDDFLLRTRQTVQ